MTRCAKLFATCFLFTTGTICVLKLCPYVLFRIPDAGKEVDLWLEENHLAHHSRLFRNKGTKHLNHRSPPPSITVYLQFENFNLTLEM